MPVKTAALGAALDSRIVEVTPRMLLSYAAGIGETGPRTFDDASPDVVASRAFCVSLEWPVISGPMRRELLGLTSAESIRGVHVEQDSVFHQPIRPGDTLETTGRINAIRPTAGGAFVQYILRTINTADGKPVTTTFSGTIFRGVETDGGIGGILESGPTLPPATEALHHSTPIYIAPEAAHVYTECSAIWNPIHTERQAALQAGLSGIILHGTATWALAGRELLRIYSNSDPTRLTRLRGRFKTPVTPGSTIYLTHTKQARQIHSEIRLDDGKPALADGYALVG